MDTTSRMTEERMALSLQHSIQRDPNPRKYWDGAIPSTDDRSLLVDIEDPTGANGMRTYTVTVHEVDPPEGTDAEVQRLAALIRRHPVPQYNEMPSEVVARWLIRNGVHA